MRLHFLLQSPGSLSLPGLASHVCLLGQGAQGDHPAGEPQHQGGGGPSETGMRFPCACAFPLQTFAASPSSLPLWRLSSLYQNCFELYNPSHKGQVIKACKTEADGRVVEGNHVVYRISAPSPEEKEEWMKSIKWVRTARLLSPVGSRSVVCTYVHVGNLSSVCQDWPLSETQISLVTPDLHLLLVLCVLVGWWAWASRPCCIHNPLFFLPQSKHQ